MRRRHMLTYVTDPSTGTVYPIPAGGSEDAGEGDAGAPDDGGEASTEDGEDTTGEDEPLGEPGKKALDSERQARRDAERRARELEQQLSDARKEKMSEQERAIEEAREQARTEALSTVNSRLFAAEVRAVATGKVADPELLSDPDVALRLLGLEEVPVTDNGDVDTEAISAALDGLVERKPYLAVSATRTTGDVDQGPRNGGTVGETPSMNDLLRAARS